ncbi:MAG: fibronectin-binding domain-containing protein [Nitrospirae bacterium]|nr:MAG: fibronectin-binding domain-containing protein [Nitrospirota bacterium]
MALSAAEISRVLQEIAPAILGGTVRKIFQPAEDVITLEIHKRRRTVLLLLSADPDMGRIHLLSRRPLNPPGPPDFCQFLRARLEGGRLVGLEQWCGDRIVGLRIAGQEGPLLLIGEFLLDAQDKILRVLKPQAAKALPLHHSYTPPLGGPWITIGHPEPEAPLDPHAFPISEEMERRYAQQETERAQAMLQRHRLRELQKAIKKTTRRLEGLTGDLTKVARYREYGRYGELLKGHLHTIAKGQDRIAVVDYFEAGLPEIVLPLDPAKDTHGNMQDYFRKYRKHLAAEGQIRPRLEAAEQELQALVAERRQLERGEWQPVTPDGPGAPRTKLRPLIPSATRREGKAPGSFRRFISADGLPILVGRNARENEQLTFGLARSHDLWFHARGVPGSHVVLRIEKDAAAPQESIRDAGTLALLYSNLRKSGKGEVMYARRSDVRKIKGKSPGTVSVTQDRSLFVDLDHARLRRLKDSPGSVSRPSY